MPKFLAAVLLLVPSLAWAADVAVVLDDSKPGTYLVTVAADGSVSASPLRVVRVGTPSPKPPPVDPTLSPFAQEIQRQTAAVLEAGGSKTTGAALSAVYSLVASGVADGSIPTTSAFAAVKSASDAVLAKQADADKWAAWRASLSQALGVLNSQGLLTTKEQIAGVLKEIAAGMDSATGNTLEPKALAGIQKGSEFAHDTDGKADGILEGINLKELIELIRLILDLIKAFKGGV